MARVNHKLVKKLLNEKRSKITDRQFFTSRVLAGHFEDMAAAQTRRALESYGLPEVDYFLETFLESFSLTLDELK